MDIVSTGVVGNGLQGRLENIKGVLEGLGGPFAMIVGLALLLHGLYRLAKAIASDGHGQTSWLGIIGEMAIGGVLAVGGGWGTFQAWSKDFGSVIE